MSPLILILTLILLAIPIVFLANVALGKSLLAAAALLVIAIYSWIWLRFRPSAFIVRPDVIEVAWPLKRRRIPRDDIANIRLLQRAELRREVGWGARLGREDSGAVSAGCGPAGEALCKCTSRERNNLFGSSARMGVRGWLRRNSPKHLCVRYLASL
jgi:hypothetical protein